MTPSHPSEPFPLGISTDSGIPDYRSLGRPPHQPLQHSQFVEASYNRKRYWARSLVGGLQCFLKLTTMPQLPYNVGYPSIKQAEPNAGHVAIATANAQLRLGTIVTQNVDGLHEKVTCSHLGCVV